MKSPAKFLEIAALCIVTALLQIAGVILAIVILLGFLVFDAVADACGSFSAAKPCRRKAGQPWRLEP